MTEIDLTLETGMVHAVPVSSIYEQAISGLAAAAQAAGGTFAAGNYYWVVTAVDAYGETTASNETTANLVLDGSAILTWNALPAGTTGVKVYRGTVPATENILVATLGPVVTYTDTGIAGVAGTPPVKNTAQIGDQVLYSGSAFYAGYALQETSGTAPVSLNINSLGNLLDPVAIAQGVTDKKWYGPNGIHARGGLKVHVVSGVFSGVIYVRYSGGG